MAHTKSTQRVTEISTTIAACVCATSMNGCCENAGVTPMHIRVTAHHSTAADVAPESRPWVDISSSLTERRGKLVSGRVDWNTKRVIVDGHVIEPASSFFIACDAALFDGTLVCAIVERMVPRFIGARGRDARIHIITSNGTVLHDTNYVVKALYTDGFEQGSPTDIRVIDRDVVCGGADHYAFVLMAGVDKYICTTIPKNGIRRFSASVVNNDVVFAIEASRVGEARTWWTAKWFNDDPCEDGQ